MSGFKGSGGSLVTWAMRKPVAIVMATLAVIVLGIFSLGSLPINFLPDIIHPRIYVRVSEPGVSARLMEQRVTHQLEKQLAITRDVTSVDSTTTEGSSIVRLGFEYGKDTEAAFHDVSTRLDRARRFLPKMIDSPIIDKRDPSQTPVMEYVISAADKSSTEIRDWVEHVFAHWFYNIPGVAEVLVGGGLEREVRVLPDQQKLAGMGLTASDIVRILNENNINEPAWQVGLSELGYGSRTEGRLTTISQLAALLIPIGENVAVRLDEVARIEDRHDKETLRVRFNGVPGVKVSIQKQPQVNTAEVVNLIKARLDWLEANQLIKKGVVVNKVTDQSVYIRDSLRNAAWAVLAGAVLAMLVVWLFLGSWRYSLIIGAAIPVSIFVSLIAMQLSGLSLNIMTIGGLALVTGMLVNSSMVMMDGIVHQRSLDDSSPELAGQRAAAEMNSPIMASASTYLLAALSFLFIGGLAGLLFRQLILTIAVAIVTSTIVALTLVPSLTVRSRLLSGRGLKDRSLQRITEGYIWFLGKLIRLRWLVIGLALIGSLLAGWLLVTGKSEFLPDLDDGQVLIHVKADVGTTLDGLDRKVLLVEDIIHQQPHVDSVFSTSGAWLSGTAQSQVTNQSSIQVQLSGRGNRAVSSTQWVNNFNASVAAKAIAGLTAHARTSRIRGISAGGSDPGVDLKIQGADPGQLARLAEAVVKKLEGQPGLQILQSSLEHVRQEYVIDIDHGRAVKMGLDADKLYRQIRTAMSGVEAGKLTDGDQIWPVNVILPEEELNSPESLKSMLISGEINGHPAIRLGDVAAIHLEPAPSKILRENQKRIVEISASLAPGYTLGEVAQIIHRMMGQVALPQGYRYYLDEGAIALDRGQSKVPLLLAVVLFPVFIVLAVQYKSVLNPLLILLSVPVSLIGVVIGLKMAGMAVSMPVWLGLIMLVGLVVSNAIMLVETTQQLYEASGQILDSALQAARRRLRPTLMTTLTAMAGMSPLAAGLGEGVEMLQPLAVTVISGLGFSLLASLILVPILYYQFHLRENRAK